jgi:hypothetical protein
VIVSSVTAIGPERFAAEHRDELRRLDDGEAVVEGVAPEDRRHARGDDRRDAHREERAGGLLAAGADRRTRARDEHVARDGALPRAPDAIVARTPAARSSRDARSR